MSVNLIASVCWCEQTTIHIPVQWVSEARTGSCGPLCGPGCPVQGADAFDDDSEIATTGKKTKMNRFSAASYDPREDSSAGYVSSQVRRELHPTDLILEVVGEQRLCACGCGEVPNGKKALFRMGHDSRLRGKLARALAGEVSVVLTDQSQQVQDVLSPSDYAARFSSDKLDWADAIKQAAERAKQAPAKGERAERRIIARAMGPQIGETKLIRIGRWEKTGRVLAVYEIHDHETLYEYVDAKGVARQVKQDVYGQMHEVKPDEQAEAS